ncbi:MAG TPA: ATP-binding protein, partial [Chroococcales cyanobacterium]
MSESDKSRSHYFASLSSELRNPLTLMLAPLESLLMGEHGPVNAEQEGVLNTVHSNAVRLLQMISGLLDYSKAESGSIQVKRQPIDVRVLTESIVSEFNTVATMRGQRLHLVPGLACPVMIDRYLFERILFNLLANAIKFTPAQGVITVALESHGERLELSVSDTGPGISEEELKGLFLEFSQHHVASMRRYEGIGLGLALVKEFAALLGGNVSVVSQLGKGSSFAVDVFAPPAAAAPPLQVNLEPARLLQQFEKVVPPYKARESVRAKNLPRVLIAEGNVELAAYIEELLADLCNTRVTTTGEEALNLVGEWQPDLILASVTMPRLDGLSLCRAIKSQSETSFIPVVLLTALTQREVMLQGWEAGADEYLFKPFHPAELVTRVRSLLRSVQQRKRAQEQIERLNEALEKRVIELASANRELKSLATMLEQARDQALEASKFKSVFLANMSHEIRTPINGVISMSDMLMRTRLNSEQVEISNIIRDSAAALLDIINDILDFSKIEAGKLDLEIVDFDLVNVVEGTAELVAEAARQKKLSLMTHVDPRLPTVLRGDPGRLRQILLNLLGNSIKFTDYGEVVVRANLESGDKHEGGRCRIKFSVSDTGIGMAPDAVRRLFKPFTQADGSITRKYGGTGLGLSIAKLLVELLGGQIGVDSVEREGSTFWFTIPLEVGKSEAPSPAVTGDLSRYKILILDPLPETAKIVKEYVNSWGMRSQCVSTGAEALAYMRRAAEQGDPFDIAMVELRLPDPDLDGFSLAQLVKNDPVLKDTLLILSTSEDPEYLGERALDRGFSACLIKPLKCSRLFDCLMLVLNLEAASEADDAMYRAARLSTTGEIAM